MTTALGPAKRGKDHLYKVNSLAKEAAGHGLVEARLVSVRNPRYAGLTD